MNAVRLLRGAAVFLAVFAFAALAGSSCHVVSTLEGTWRGVLDPPPPWRVGAALLLGLAAAAAERARPRLFAPLLSLGLAALPLLPVATGAALPLLLFQGATLALVFASAACVALVDFLPGPRRAWPWPVPFALALAFFAALSTRWPGPAGAQGDEPHYLTMAESLRSDLDLDLRDEFRQRAYRAFYPGDLAAHTSPASPRRRLYAIHTPGLPVLVLPAYVLGGAEAVRGFLVLLAAAAAALVHALVRDVLRDEALARAAFAAFVCLAPVAIYANQIYPELPAALATAIFLHTARGDATMPALLASGTAAAVLLWLHPKFLILAGTGLALSLIRPGGSASGRAAASLLLATSLAALLSWMNVTYGEPSLTAAYGPGARDDVQPAHWLRGLPGLLIDREFGLLLHAPLWAFAAWGLRPLWRDRPGDVMRALLLSSPTVLIGSAYRMWWGGACPPARFLVPAMPALALLLAPALARRPRLSAGLFGLGIGVILVASSAPRALHNRGDGESALLRVLAPALRLDRALPSFVGARIEWDPLTAGDLDPRGAALRALEDWDGANVKSAAGRLAPESLVIPLLEGPPWRLAMEEIRGTPRVALPAGFYEVGVRGGFEPGATGAAVRVVITREERELARGLLGDAEPELVIGVDLATGARRFEVWATGLRDAATIAAIELRPRRVSPRSRR